LIFGERLHIFTGGIGLIKDEKNKEKCGWKRTKKNKEEQRLTTGICAINRVIVAFCQ